MDNDIGAGFNFRLNGFVLQNIGSDQAMSSLCVCFFGGVGGGNCTQCSGAYCSLNHQKHTTLTTYHIPILLNPKP